MNIGDKYAPTMISPVAIGPVMAVEQMPAPLSICRFLIRSAPDVD